MIFPDLELIGFDFGFGPRQRMLHLPGSGDLWPAHKMHRKGVETSPDASRAQGQGYHACQLPPCAPAHIFRSPVRQAELQCTAICQPSCSRSKLATLWMQTIWQQRAQVACLHKSAPDDAELCTGSFLAADDDSL